MPSNKPLPIPENFAERARTGATIPELETEFSVSSDTIKRWRRVTGTRLCDLGLLSKTNLPKAPQSLPPPPEVQVIRPQIYAPRKYRGTTRPQVQVLCLSDPHAGAITPSYNPGVFKTRMKDLYHGVTLIRSLHAKQHPIEKLVIFCLGDVVQGENVGYQMSLDEYAYSVYDQCYKLWLPAAVEFIENLLGQYSSIEWYGVKGNHGLGGNRIASRSTNWDMVAHQALMNTLGGNKRITFKLEPTEFYLIVPVLKWKWMLLHGDARSFQAAPDYMVNRRMAEWELSLGVDGFAMGHWHRTELRWPRKSPIVLSGTLKSHDEYSLRYYGSSAIPSQATFGCHMDRPITWFYRLDLGR